MKQKDQRAKEIARIQILRKELGLADDAYEAVLWAAGRVESSRDLDERQRPVVIRQLEKLMEQTGRKPKRYQRPALSKSELVSKIRAQLMSFTPPRPDAYADGMSKRMFKVDQFTWCEPGDLWKLVAALAYEQERRGAPRG